ncbi:MAG: class I SAM-dependent RNA methyltransferase [Bacteroidota bacterium]|nr:class I SAM-dependent RNA methyltransferase [Bacteroidota bacterium]
MLEIPLGEKSFATLFAEELSLLRQRALPTGECQTARSKLCTLCAAHKVNYDDEYGAKNRALQKFLSSISLGNVAELLIRSPLGREYRSVSKRKAFRSPRGIRFGLIGFDDEHEMPFALPVEKCVIEHESHSAIHRDAEEFLSKRENTDFAECFNYIVVKGNYEEQTVIFNLNSFDAVVRRYANALSRFLTRRVPTITGLFVFVDEGRSRYYLSHRSSGKKREEKIELLKIFGASKIFLKVNGKKFLYHPLSFSQTNPAILQQFVETISSLLRPSSKNHLLDLYCGYGLFSLCLADKVKSVTGIELARESVHDAEENAKRQRSSHCRFVAGDISAESLEHIIRTNGTHTLAILDPPRNGTRPGVIEFLASKKVERAVHIFCNIEIMERELERWKNSGYRIARVAPFDMFPGTDEVEIAVGLSR